MAPTPMDEKLARFEAWAETVDVDKIVVEDLSDLRALAVAADNVARAELDVVDLVGASRNRGRSWAEIGRALGTSRQGARQRFSVNDGAQQSPGTPASGRTAAARVK